MLEVRKAGDEASALRGGDLGDPRFRDLQVWIEGEAGADDDALLVGAADLAHRRPNWVGGQEPPGRGARGSVSVHAAAQRPRHGRIGEDVHQPAAEMTEVLD